MINTFTNNVPNRYSGFNPTNIGGTYLESTPVDSNPNPFSKYINLNYSHEVFNKKKTLSKSKYNNDDIVIHSPFGPISPMINGLESETLHAKRGSNVIRDCSSGGMDMFGLMFQRSMPMMYNNIDESVDSQEFKECNPFDQGMGQ